MPGIVGTDTDQLLAPMAPLAIVTPPVGVNIRYALFESALAHVTAREASNSSERMTCVSLP